jgi:RNA polymerase sigma-70 factor (ECF subfamily)
MDEAAFDEFYQASFGRIAAQVYAMIGDRDEAQECVQEAFARAWSHRRKLDRAQHPEAWVRTTAYRYAVSRWRRRTLAKRPPDRAVSADLVSRPPGPEHVAVMAALQQLPDAQRRAIVLHHLCDLSVREVAEETGVAEGTVKARLSRGRTALADLISDPRDVLSTRDHRGADHG